MLGLRYIGVAIVALLIAWNTSSARADALQLVMFEQVACEWCHVWNREIGAIYAKTDEGRQAPLRRVDIHDPRPDDLRQIRGVTFTPTFVVFDGRQELGRITGYISEHFFWELLNEILAQLPESSPSPLIETGGT